MSNLTANGFKHRVSKDLVNTYFALIKFNDHALMLHEGLDEKSYKSALFKKHPI
jgi:hypothetical protein